MTQPADNAIWWRDDAVWAALRAALDQAVEAHGNAAKAVAWDVKTAFYDQLMKGTPQ